jgi:uncharacterized membrane protein YeaQ/YmgE (transglycosylase-associated protein family)
MKSTIYVDVLIAIVVGALVGCLGVFVQQSLKVSSPIMEAVIIGVVAAVISVLIVRGASEAVKSC